LAALPCCLAAQTQSPAPLTVQQKYDFTSKRVFGYSHLFWLAAHAEFEQARDQPREWGAETGGYGSRLASDFGRTFVRENIAFAVRAADREDPRYFPLGKGSIWTRTRYALRQTFFARRDDGEWMPAYSRFVADYATPFISRQWQPSRFRGAGQGFANGSIGIGVGLGSNLGQEFAPDLKKLVRRFHH
jgi:hypothetical protein